MMFTAVARLTALDAALALLFTPLHPNYIFIITQAPTCVAGCIGTSNSRPLSLPQVLICH